MHSVISWRLKALTFDARSWKSVDTGRVSFAGPKYHSDFRQLRITFDMGSKTKVTAAYVDGLISDKGGYSKKTLQSLGVPWPPKKGWEKRLIRSYHGEVHGKPERASAHKDSRKKIASKAFYASWEWKKVRYEALKMHGRQCMCCGWSPSPGSKGRLCVDHIKPRSKHPSLALALSNLQILCDECNRGKSNVHEDDFRSEWHGEDDSDADVDPLTAQFNAIMQ